MDLKSGKIMHTFSELIEPASKLILHKDHLLICGSDDGFIRIWDLTDYSSVHFSERFPAYISCLIVQNDIVVAGIGDGNIATINLKNSFITTISKKHTDATNLLYAKATTIISCSTYDKTINTWNLLKPNENYFSNQMDSGVEGLIEWNNRLYLYLENGEIVIVELINNKIELINSVQISLSGSNLIRGYKNYLIAASGDDITVLDLNNNTSQLLGSHGDMITSLCIKDNYLLSGSFDKKIKIWSLDNLSAIKTLSGHSYYISRIEVYDEIILSLEDNGQLFFWKFDLNNTEENITLLKYECYGSLSFKEFLIYLSSNEIILLDTFQFTYENINFDSGITSLDCYDYCIYFITTENELYCMNIPEMKIITKREINDNSTINGLADNKLFVTSKTKKDEKYLVSVFSKNNLELITTYESDIDADHIELFNNIYLILGSKYSDRIEIRDPESFRKLNKFKISKTKGMSCIDHFTMNKNSLIYCTDSEVYSCDLKTGACQKHDHIHIDKLYGYDANNTFMALSGWVYHDIQVYEKESLNLVQHFEKHATTVDTIKIIGDKIIISSIDRTILVWSICDQQIITRLNLDESIETIDYNEVSKIVIMTGESGRLYLFQACGFSFDE